MREIYTAQQDIFFFSLRTNYRSTSAQNLKIANSGGSMDKFKINSRQERIGVTQTVWAEEGPEWTPFSLALIRYDSESWIN